MNMLTTGFRYVSGVLVIIGVLFLVACGVESTTPSPTPQPTVVSGGLDTMVPSTSTPQSAPSETISSPAAATGTVPPGGTTGPQGISDADREWISNGFSNTIALRSYHYRLKLDDPQAGTADIEGDYVAPDKLYNKGTVVTETREVLKIGTQVYRRHTGTGWQPSDQDVQVNPAIFLNSYSVSDPVLSDWSYVGRETIDMTTVDHFEALENHGLIGGLSAGTAGLWRDVQSGNLYRFQNNTDPRPFAATMAAVGPNDPQVAPTLTAWATDHSFFEITFTRWNDPSITIPLPTP